MSHKPATATLKETRDQLGNFIEHIAANPHIVEEARIAAGKTVANVSRVAERTMHR